MGFTYSENICYPTGNKISVFIFIGSKFKMKITHLFNFDLRVRDAKAFVDY